MPSDPPRDEAPRQQALADVRDALAGLRSIPVAGLDSAKAETILDVVETVGSIEKQLANERDQREDDGDVSSYLPSEVAEQ